MKSKNTNRNPRLLRTIILILIVVTIYNMLIVLITSILNKSGKDVFGYKAYIITANSMKPNISAGDIIIIKQVEEQDLKTDDIITYKTDSKTITHRIIDIIVDENNTKSYITKGDNNNLEDKEHVSYSQIEGKKILRIPLLGKVAILLQDEIYIVLTIIIILLIYLAVQKKEEKEKIRREKKKEEDEKFKENNM